MASPFDLRLNVPVDRARFLVGTALTEQGFAVEPTTEGLRVTRGSMGVTVAVGAFSGNSMHVGFDLITTPTDTGTHVAVDQSELGTWLKGGAVGAAKARDVVQEAMHRLGTTLADQGVLEGPVPPPVGYSDRTNIVAIFALVLGFLVPIGGIVAGIIGLRQVKRTGEKGKGLAIAGIAIGSTLTVLYTVLIVLALILAPLLADASRSTDDAVPYSQGEAPLPDEDDDAALIPVVGDCISDSGIGLEFADCTESHEYEVYFVSQVTGDVFPGDDAVTEQADLDCAAAFPSFAGIAYEESSLAVNFITPDAGLWASGDRQITCLISDPTGPTIGTLAGAGR